MATMTTSGMQATLSVPTADDTMEISSDAGRADQDIDIDFMGSEHGDNDVDWMLQDAASERGNAQADAPQTHNDDLMYDDGEELTYVEEDAMQDDVPEYTEDQTETADLEIDFDPHPATEETLFDVDAEEQHDYQQPEEETLIDFDTFDEHVEHHGDEAQAPSAEGAVEPLRPVDTHFDATEDHAAEVSTHTGDSADQTTDAWNESTAPQAAPLATELETAVQHHKEDVVGQVHEESVALPEELSAVQATPQYDPTAFGEPDKGADATQEEWTAATVEDTVAEGTQNPPQGETTSATIAAPSLHPVKVTWASNETTLEYSLFQSSVDDDPNSYFLQDSSVASSTLTDLFRACRSVLDQQLTDDIELELYVHPLQLTISEDSAQCHSNSLAQILEVYVNLSHNDGLQEVPALRMDLYTKDRLSAQLSSLFQAATEKTGLSYLFPEASEEGEQSYQEEDDGRENQPDQQEHTFDGEHTEVVVPQHEANEEDTYEQEPDTAVQEQDQVFAAEGDNTAFTEALDVFDSSADLENGDLGHQEEAVDFSLEPEQEQEQEQEQDQDEGAPQAVEEAEQDFVHVDEERDGGSSGSSTVQGETQPEPARGYTPSLEDKDEWLIDYDDEDDEDEASLETAEVTHEQSLGEDETEIVEETQIESLGEAAEHEGHGQAHITGEEQLAESFDEHAFDETDTLNQAFDEHADYHDEPEHHEDGHEGDEQADDQEDWTYEDDTQYAQVDAATTQESGTFQVPSSTEADEDEIDFDDDEFTADNAQTGDAAAVQDRAIESPLGKRGRDEEDDGAHDGSDQESKRLKAA